MSTEVAALLVAAVSLLVAGLSLGWQIAQWLLSAGRPKAVLLFGIQVDAGVVSGPVPKSGKPPDLRTLRQQGMNGPTIIGIKVTNHGRAPLVIERVSIRVRGGGLSFENTGNTLGPPLPHRLDPGTNGSWFLPADDAARLLDGSRKALSEKVSGVYMTADLGTGKAVGTPTTLRA